LIRRFLCLIALAPSLTVAAKASWDGWQSGGVGWRGGIATISYYYGCYGYDYPYYAATVIRLTGGYGYVPIYSYGYGCRSACGSYVRHRLYAAVRGVRRVRTHRSAAAVSSLGLATNRSPSSPAKTVQGAGSALPKSAWTPMTVPVSPSPSNEPPTATEEGGQAASDWAKKFELKLNQLSPDMSAATALLAQEGFRVDGGNKSATGWFLTAHDNSQRRGNIRLQSDGAKIVLTVTGPSTTY
jgi:hypothetical protein